MYGFYVSGVDLTKFTDVPQAKVESGYEYKYNSETNNRTGTLDAVTNNIQRASGNANRFRLKGVVR